VDAAIVYASSAPGLVAGILQINARIPETVSSGSAVAVDLFIGGGRSQPGVSIAIR
jgi:uncharacterized protein (TIGR03437 family)